jgi:GNAT superfamily N-acetyltransferase
MQLANVSRERQPLQSVAIKWVVGEEARAALTDDLMARTEFSDTSPFMDWVEEAGADTHTQILGAYNSDLNQWAGFLACRTEYEIKPERPGKAKLATEIQIESLYVTESERGKKIASVMMEMAMDAINNSIEEMRTKNLLLKMDVEITFIADCGSAESYQVASKGLNRLLFLRKDVSAMKNQISLVGDQEYQGIFESESV